MPNVLNPVGLDASTLATSTLASDSSVAAIIAINVIHVSPPSVLAGLIAGAGTKLRKGGWLFFYGPFSRDGVIDGEGNNRFQKSLEALNPEFGLRDITAIKTAGEAYGLRLVEEVFLETSGNFILGLKKA